MECAQGDRRPTRTWRPSTGSSRSLSWPHLIALGRRRDRRHRHLHPDRRRRRQAGPAVILSFVIAGVVCACAALAYAELATMIPAAGSAYTYTYIVLGEMVAWVVGWSLILEYSLCAARSRSAGRAIWSAGSERRRGLCPRLARRARLRRHRSTCRR